jgi:large subunit ribosomal protein L10
MALTRASKTEKVKKLAAELQHSTSAIIGTFKGLTASKDFELRKTIRKAGGNYHVVKNKLAARAAEGSKVEGALKGLKGVSAVAYTSGDPVALAKALSEWVKDNAEFTFKLGIVDGKVINISEIEQLAKMPGKEELFSKLLFLINSPAQRLATVINATGRDLAVVINQGVEKGKFAAPAAAAAPVVEVKPETPAAEAKSEAPAAEVKAEVPVAEVKAEVPAVETKSEAAATEAAAHVEESAAGEQPSGAAQPENSTASQGGEAAGTDPVEG